MAASALTVLRLAALLAVLALGVGPVWAQAAETAHAIAGATDTFLGQGILGAIIVVETVLLVWLYKDGRAATREAFEGLRSSSDAVKDLTAGLKGMDERADNRHALVKDLPEQLRDLGDIGKRNTSLLENNKDALGRLEDRLDDRPPRRRTGA